MADARLRESHGEHGPADPAEPCPSAETIAGYIDHRLNEQERGRIEAHLTRCSDCYVLFTETLRFQQEEAQGAPASPATSNKPSAPVLPFAQRHASVVTASALAFAASVVLTVFIWRPAWLGFAARELPELQELIAAVGDSRPIEARLTGGFQWGPYRGPTRGASDRDMPPDVRIAAARIEQVANRRQTPESLHVLGVAELVIGDFDAAVSTLERAAASSPDNARILNDLAAAYVARGSLRGNVLDYSKAASSVRRAIEINPTLTEALFNRALALDRLRRADGAGAWTAYLEADGNSKWAAEAREHLRQ